jgi:hypothetical protein
MKINITVNDQEVNDFLETAETVKGEKFADYVKFLIITLLLFLMQTEHCPDTGDARRVEIQRLNIMSALASHVFLSSH